MIKTVNPGGGTDAMAFMNIASQYYLNKTYSPIDKNSKCQKSYILVIGDGDWYNHNRAVKSARNLYNKIRLKWEMNVVQKKTDEFARVVSSD